MPTALSLAAISLSPATSLVAATGGTASGTPEHAVSPGSAPHGSARALLGIIEGTSGASASGWLGDMHISVPLLRMPIQAPRTTVAAIAAA